MFYLQQGENELLSSNELYLLFIHNASVQEDSCHLASNDMTSVFSVHNLCFTCGRERTITDRARILHKSFPYDNSLLLKTEKQLSITQQRDCTNCS